MMKKIILNAIILTGLILGIVSCKKGEDDPAFTLLTRKARVAGNWKLQKANMSFVTTDSIQGRIGYKYEFTESACSFTNTSTGAFVKNMPSNLMISFTKKGTYTLSQTMGSTVLTATGVWDFLGKGSGYKNKERIMMRFDRIIGNSNYLDMFNMSLTPFNYDIRELRNKKMVLVAKEEVIAASSGGVLQSVTAEYTFVQ